MDCLETVNLDQLKFILNKCPELITIINKESKFEFANSSYCEAVNKNMDEIIDQEVKNIWGEKRYNAYIKEYIETCFQGKKIKFKAWFILGKRGRRYMEVTYHPFRNKDNEISHIIVISKDITDNERLNQLFVNIESIKLELETCIDSIENFIIVINKSGEIIRCNTSFQKFTEKPFSKLFHVPYEHILEEKGFQTKDLIGENIEIYHRDSENWYTFNSYPFKDKKTKKFSGVVIVLNNITEFKKMTNELQDTNDKLKKTQAQIIQQEKLASIGQLAAGVAHEINNPIGFINSNLRNLVQYIGVFKNIISELNSSKTKEEIIANAKNKKIDFILEDIDDLLKENQDGLARVTNIVKNLRDFARIDQNEDFSTTDFNELVKSTLNIAKNEIKYDITIKEKYGKIDLVECNGNEINQVFLNILVNAAQAIKEHKHKKNTSPDYQGKIEITTLQDEEHVICKISDNGPGIPEEVLPRIFDPFFTTKDVGEGTGLGLNISYDIITNKHKGVLEVKTKIHEGTCFVIKLPRDKNKNENQS